MHVAPNSLPLPTSALHFSGTWCTSPVTSQCKVCKSPTPSPPLKCHLPLTCPSPCVTPPTEGSHPDWQVTPNSCVTTPLPQHWFINFQISWFHSESLCGKKGQKVCPFWTGVPWNTGIGNIRMAMKYQNHLSFLTHKVYNSQKSPSEQK